MIPVPCEMWEELKGENQMGEAARLLKLDQGAAEIKDSQNAIARLLDKEDLALELFNELPAIENYQERMDKAGQLFNDCNDMIELSKELEAIMNRVRKRMEKVKGAVMEGITDEVKETFETKNWKFRLVNNPPSVIVDDLAKVPKKYRTEPKPIPAWEKWPAAKTVIKDALTKEKVQSIPGVHIKDSTRVEVKPR
jgi:hypothetical protein